VSQPTANVCAVCGGALTQDRATCYTCGSEFHLALRTDRPAIDCGVVWIDEESQALTFGCNRCLGRAPAGGGRGRRRHEGLRAREVARVRGRRRSSGAG